ncbi:PyrBI operon leader peptide, partial [Salmonella enterica]|nr:PyrBI operon leader peptide [Salmonella enterica]
TDAGLPFFLSVASVFVKPLI